MCLGKAMGHIVGALISKVQLPFLSIVLFFWVLLLFDSQIFFINRTASMPRGLYFVVRKNNYETGDVIVFKANVFKGNLIKYISAVHGDRYCFDETSFLWVNTFPIAQKNIQKYPQLINEQSICHPLSPDELLVIGDHENSYDSRYFGPIKKHDVIASVKLIWPFN